MSVVGVDGCRSGWICVSMDGAGRQRFEIVARAEVILGLSADLTLVDAPIGLPDTGERACDLAARAKLGRGWPRVFTGIRRPLLDFVDDYPAANSWAKSDGKGLSKQAHSILRKIAELDETMESTTQERVRETHPELVFQRLNRGEWLPSKKIPEGRVLRRNLLFAAGFRSIDDWLLQLRGSGAGADDLLDACACTLAARDAAQGSGRRIECEPEVDRKGLRMEMWF